MTSFACSSVSTRLTHPYRNGDRTGAGDLQACRPGSRWLDLRGKRLVPIVVQHSASPCQPSHRKQRRTCTMLTSKVCRVFTHDSHGVNARGRVARRMLTTCMDREVAC